MSDPAIKAALDEMDERIRNIGNARGRDKPIRALNEAKALCVAIERWIVAKALVAGEAP